MEKKIQYIERPENPDPPKMNKVIMNEMNIDQLRELVDKMTNTEKNGDDINKKTSVIIIFPENYKNLVENLNIFHGYISNLVETNSIYDKHFDNYIELIKKTRKIKIENDCQ